MWHTNAQCKTGLLRWFSGSSIASSLVSILQRLVKVDLLVSAPHFGDLKGFPVHRSESWQKSEFIEFEASCLANKLTLRMKALWERSNVFELILISLSIGENEQKGNLGEHGAIGQFATEHLFLLNSLEVSFLLLDSCQLIKTNEKSNRIFSWLQCPPRVQCSDENHNIGPGSGHTTLRVKRCKSLRAKHVRMGCIIKAGLGMSKEIQAHCVHWAIECYRTYRLWKSKTIQLHSRRVERCYTSNSETYV